MTILHLNAKVPSRGRGSCTAPAEKTIPMVTAGARAVALAHYIEDALEAGSFASAAEIAECLGVTRARVSQVTALLGLAPRLQEQVLMGEVVMSGRGLRHCLSSAVWAVQEEVRHTSPRRGTWRPPEALRGVGASTGQYGQGSYSVANHHELIQSGM